MIDAGRLRDRVTLLAPGDPDERDSTGEPSATPVAAGTCWAEVRPLSGREAERARQVVAEATHAVTMRDVGIEITPRHSLTWHSKWGDKTLGIGSALFNEQDAEWAIVATEAVDS